MESNKPKKRFSTGAISATIWENQAISKNAGAPVSFNTISMQRRYKDKEGVWKSTNSLRVLDLPKAILVMQKAFEYLTLRELESSPSSNDSQTEEANAEEIVM
jgi:hypothetical protein